MPSSRWLGPSISLVMWSVAGCKLPAPPSADLEKRIEALEDRLAVFENLEVRWCGNTDATNAAFEYEEIRGIAAAKAMCQASCASATAHMCSVEEVGRIVENGGDPPAVEGNDSVWVFSGSYSYGPEGSDLRDDCRLFTTSDPPGGSAGVSWYPPQQRMVNSDCISPWPIACCDWAPASSG